MENILQADITAAIERSLPKQVGTALQEQLNRLSYLEKKDIQSTIRITTLEKLVENHDKLKKIESNLNIREADLDIKLKSIEEKQRDFKIAVLEIKLEEATKRSDGIVGFVNSLTRNTLFRKSILDSENKGGLPVVDSQGFSHYPVPSSKQFEETKSEE